MPRAFLITHRRYNEKEEMGEHGEIGGESSPEHKVSLPEELSPPPSSINDESSNSSSCPDELYNLTKLAEVSLAAAAGQIYHHRHLSAHSHIQATTQYTPLSHISYAHKLFDRGPRGQQRQQAAQALLSPTSSTEESHECPDCGKRYSTSSNLARHRQTHRSLADKKARRCPHCDKVYVSMPAYSMHVRTHNQGCKCHFCGKCFSRPWLLQGHIRTHTGEKPFKCTVCGKAFADKSNLRAHVQTHSSTKPHVCGRCGKAFALKSYLYKHEESSCMRSVRSALQQTEPVQFQPTSAPTPVIVRPERQPPFRSTVISPNPERALYANIELPARYCIAEDQPVDFSAARNEVYREENTGYAIGLAIAV